MNHNELRKGNYVIVRKETCSIYSTIEHNALIVVYRVFRNYIPMSEVNPIPISKRWLKKLGFEQQYGSMVKNGIYYNIENEKVGIAEGRVKIWVDLDKLSHIKYIHQLQNLYFCLYNEELVINK